MLATLVVLAVGRDEISLLQDQCLADSERLCKNVPGGWTGVYRCLKQQESSLSRDCRQQLAASEQLYQDCRADVDKFCSDIYPRGGRVLECLTSQRDELSGRCKRHVIAAIQAVENVQEACTEDTDRLCSDVRPGAGRLMRCLKEHEAELSKKCKATLGSGK